MKIYDLLKRYCLRASSLIEVIVSGLIISMIFGIALVTYLNVQKSGVSLTKLSYTVMLQEAYSKAISSGNFIAQEEDHDNVRLVQDVFPSNHSPNLLVLHIEVRSRNGKLLAERNDLIHVSQ